MKPEESPEVELRTPYPQTVESLRLQREALKVMQGGKVSAADFIQDNSRALRDMLSSGAFRTVEQQKDALSNVPTSQSEAFANPRSAHHVVVLYDHKTRSVTLGYRDDAGDDKKIVIAAEAFAQHDDPGYVVAGALEGVDVMPAVADVVFDAWVEFVEVARGNSTARSRPEPLRFPETADPVLARLEAEIAMCEDAMQKTRLEAIFGSLKKFAPVVPSGA